MSSAKDRVAEPPQHGPLVVVVYAAAIAGWQFFLLPNSDAIRGGLPFVLINLVFGFALGRWAAVSLSLVIVVLAIPFFDQTYGEGTSIGGVIVFAAVCAAVLLGIGVLARLAIDRLRAQG